MNAECLEGAVTPGAGTDGAGAGAREVVAGAGTEGAEGAAGATGANVDERGEIRPLTIASISGEPGVATMVRR